jgi:hypothetical protein
MTNPERAENAEPFEFFKRLGRIGGRQIGGVAGYGTGA